MCIKFLFSEQPFESSILFISYIISVSKMTTFKLLLVLSFGFLAVSAFGGSEDKFIKKYAMMKVSTFNEIFNPL